MSMRKKNKFLLLILLLLVISLGYALLTQDLTINGITTVKGNTWDIHFDNVQINSNSVPLSTGDSAATIDSNNDTIVNYTITLSKPGDFYEFTVDAVNEGTVDGMIGEVINKLNGTPISSTNPLPVYLDYSFAYADGTTVASNHLLEAGHTETYKVRVEFKRDIENSELPSIEQNNTLSFGINYLQRSGSAIPVPHPVVETVYTANLLNYSDEANTIVRIGSTIQDSITKYSTASEAMAALTLANYGRSVPVSLKHTTVDDVVTESYVEFVITEAMANEYPEMTAGTYILRGAGATIRYYNDDEDYEYNEDSPYYEENKEVLKTAFGEENCAEATAYKTYYNCFLSTWEARASVTTDGSVDYGCPLGMRALRNFSCEVDERGFSYCIGPEEAWDP